MYPHFIEINILKQPVLLNIDSIDAVQETIIHCGKGGTYFADESYDELKQLIRDSGCHIQKADPRLDNKPLTVDDLKTMLGEPVWNSNEREWALVIEIGIHCIMFGNCHGTQYAYGADDLLKYPLYRMKEA